VAEGNLCVEIYETVLQDDHKPRSRHSRSISRPYPFSKGSGSLIMVG